MNWSTTRRVEVEHSSDEDYLLAFFPPEDIDWFEEYQGILFCFDCVGSLVGLWLESASSWTSSQFTSIAFPDSVPWPLIDAVHNWLLENDTEV